MEDHALIPPLTDLSPEARDAVAPTLTRQSIRRGEKLFGPGDPSTHLFVISSGKMKITRPVDDRECVLALLGPGQVFGDVSIFTAKPRTTLATAVTRTELVAMPAEDVLGLSFEVPEFARLLLQLSSHRVHAANDTNAALVTSDAPGRLARLIIQLADQFGREEPGGIVLHHDLTQAELAQMVGASRETVNKALVDFTNREWIHCASRSVTILNQRGLLDRAS